MTQVDFYVLTSANASNIEQFVCLLTEKAFKQGHKIHIHTVDEQQSTRVDNLLWTFKELSFLPHVKMGDEQQSETPIHISHEQDKAFLADVLINLKSEVPVFYQQFERVAEIVSADPVQRQTARQRYRHYQQQGDTVTSHEVNR